jgi:RNA polymerase sigma factor (sigma-70 family)
MSEWTPDIARLARFDDAEWLKVESTFCGRLMAYASRRIRDRQAREDVVQETFLGAVRGIDAFDPAFTFEQYLFGICRNRTIDHLRRQKMVTLGAPAEGEEAGPAVEDLVSIDETPSRIVRKRDLSEAGVRMLSDLLRAWVEETWTQNEFTRLMVVEALFAGAWRNRDTWERFDLRDETSVAGIKFRALKRLRELAQERDTQKRVLPWLTAAVDGGEGLDIDVQRVWREGRVSCPARHWIARRIAGTLPAGPATYLAFHLDEMRCEWCRANQDDLSGLENAGELEAVMERVGASTLQLLRSRTRDKKPD